MSHRAEYEEELLYDDEKKKFYNSITASWKEKRLEVIRCYGRKDCLYRNMYFYGCSGGWLVSFPGEKNKGYYGTGIQKLEEWYSCKKIPGVYVIKSEWNADYCLSKNPNLKYLLRKIPSKISLNYLVEFLNNFTAYPIIENLVMANQYELATNKTFLRMEKNRQKEIISFLLQNKDNYNMKLNTIQKAIKYKISYEEAQSMGIIKDLTLYKYLAKQLNDNHYSSILEAMRTYRDYKNMVIDVGHSFEDDYWKYPKNLGKAEQKMNEEYKVYRHALDKDKISAFEELSKQFATEMKIDGFKVYIPTSYEDVENQAKELHQCLIQCDYPNKVIHKQSILVFIKKEEKPIGTFEINYQKKTLQAYGNEIDRSNCCFNEELNSVKSKFLKLFKVPDKEKLFINF